MKNLFAMVAVMSMYSIAGQMDYIDAKIQDKLNSEFYAQVSSQEIDSDSEYIANVCSGVWIDTENMNPECQSLEEYEEFK